jgi:endonuclease YncB( thermonuclease family)
MWCPELERRIGQSAIVMRNTVRTSLFTIVLACCTCAHAQTTLTGVARILDADTLVLNGERVRVQGIDSPELDQTCLDHTGSVWNCGIDARNRLVQHIGSRATSCVTNGKDVFGRWLATCSTDEGDLGAWLVREGIGMAFVRYSKKYAADEAVARSTQQGMWAGAFVAPWDWRHRTASTAILGFYKPTEQQARALHPPAAQLQSRDPSAFKLENYQR